MSGGFRVSDSTIETAARGYWADFLLSMDTEAETDPAVQRVLAWDSEGLPEWIRERERKRAAASLAAVLPSLVAEIREQIAGEIEAIDVTRRVSTRWLIAKECARVARGDAG